MPGISIISLNRVNLYPKAETSNNRVEIFVAHQAFIKIITLENRAPFFNNNNAKGKAAFLPIYLLSNEKVIMPTNVRVEISAPTCAKPAPLLKRVFPSEKATKVGIITIDPITAEVKTPKNPEFFPRSLDIVEGSTIDNNMRL